MPTPHVPKEALPTDFEFKRLQDIALEWFPVLVPRGDRALSMDEFHAQFKLSFAWLLTAARREGLAGKYDIAFWAGKAARFHRRDGLGIKPFLCAAVAVGDVPFSTFNDLPYGLALGLVDADRNVDVSQARVAWQRVLAGKLLAPIALYPSSTVSPQRPMGGRVRS